MTDTPLIAEGLVLGYDGKTVLHDLSLRLPGGQFTAIVGPNACGKSTLLRALARLLTPHRGRVLLHGQPLERIAPRQMARQVALLPQNPIEPDGITVRDLVARGRYPHQTLLRPASAEDATAVEQAMARLQITDLATRRVADLSGGQRQRVWIAMVLAQDTQVILLDEPTTWLDIAHQVELMTLLAQLAREGRTIVAVLHELNHAFRYAHHLVALRDGRLMAEGAPSETVTPALIEAVFDLPCVITPDPLTGAPMVVPHA
ncbi:ABC transporter ATP-binding protein [Cereibacter sphaeroides]|nr:ABC transporter ATP-binding protein [Cereibacter sphaeroides]